MAVSKHVKVMVAAGLIRREKDGRVQWCSYDPAAMGAANQWIEIHQRFWSRQLDSLASWLEAPSDRDSSGSTSD